MVFFNERNRDGRTVSESDEVARASRTPPDRTGLEAADLKGFVESGATVIVVLESGERLRGRIRYYDRDCFSVGPADGGPRIFLRKSGIRYLHEES
jgi:hypothetical protein